MPSPHIFKDEPTATHQILMSRAKWLAREASLRWKTASRWRARKTAARQPHGLPGKLVVSLTSYPPRFGTLALTLRTLLSQSVAPDEVVLWIADSDHGKLPAEVLALRGDGLRIGRCDDLKSYKKIIPTLSEWPEAFVVTADDDVYYWPTWLAELVAEFRADRPEVLCHRAHRVALLDDGMPGPYTSWEIEIEGEPASPLVFPTGVGGVFYPPGALHERVLDLDLMQRLSPTADDVWLYFMAHLAGHTARKVGNRRRFVPWVSTQRVSLMQNNVADGGNDRQMMSMARHFGAPRPA